MKKSINILEKITTSYSVFEKDQVLTEAQLNGVTDYLNDQSRQSLVYLLGVGIASGLQVSYLENSGLVRVTKGVGVTTDGELLVYSQDMFFDRFMEYNESHPKYLPFHLPADDQMITIYELIATVPNSPQRPEPPANSIPISAQLEILKETITVLYMESYINDPDLCSTCDNLGKECINTIKLLLIPAQHIDLLTTKVETPTTAFGQLHELSVDRAIIKSTDNAESFQQIYRQACASAIEMIIPELTIFSQLYPSLTFFHDVFSSDPNQANNPIPLWQNKLQEYNSTISNNGRQYYYDFLKDFTETYNQMRDLLFGDYTWNCPESQRFPKHLLLGDLFSNGLSNNHRTAFYPSSMLSRTTENIQHAKFLLRKLDSLIASFQVPTNPIELRITPSMTEDQPLADRAIPFYYQIETEKPIHKYWNYPLSQRDMANHNYSYRAQEYQAPNAVTNPFTKQIGRFTFFRIEGHIGQKLVDVLPQLENKISTNNLPFTVRAILLGNAPDKLVKKPGIRYSDLHRMHYLLRQDAVHQLNEVVDFSGKFKTEVNQKVQNETRDYLVDAIERDNTISQSANGAVAQLQLDFTQFSNVAVKPLLTNTVKAASRFKVNSSEVIKTDFTSPFDTLIGSTHIHWIDWLDQIITTKDEKESEKLLLKNFLVKNPGLEHYAGVNKGGTFVLVYDEQGIVVADLMLPYHCAEDAVETNPPEPPLVKPTIKPDILPIRVIPSIEKRKQDLINSKELSDRLVSFTGEEVFTKKIELQNKYFEVYKGYVNSTSQYLGAMNNPKLSANPAIKDVLTNPTLRGSVNLATSQQGVVEALKEQSTQLNLPEQERAVLNEKIVLEEAKLADVLHEAVVVVAASGQDLSVGSEGFQALLNINQSMETLDPNSTALQSLKANLVTTSEKTNIPNFKMIVGNMLNK
jgi:hypothetical protein